MECAIDDLEATSNLLKDFYTSISDLSYNEYSVFYWDCLKPSKCTPKGNLDMQVMEDAANLYAILRDMHSNGEHRTYIKAIDEDQIIADCLGFNDFDHQNRCQQAEAAQKVINDTIEHILAENGPFSSTQGGLQSLQSFSLDACKGLGPNNSNNNSHALIWNKLQKYIPSHQKAALGNLDSEQSMAMEKLIINKYGYVNDFMAFYEKINRSIESLEKELHEIKEERHYRSYYIIDEEYDCFFLHNLNASLAEIDKMIKMKKSKEESNKNGGEGEKEGHEEEEEEEAEIVFEFIISDSGLKSKSTGLSLF